MEHDEALNALYSTLERRTSQITEAVLKPNNAAAGSLDSLTMVVRYLGETNKDVVHVLLRSKKDIRDIRELRELMLLYFRRSHKTLEFLNTLHEWLHGRRGLSWPVDRLKGAIRKFKNDNTSTGYGRKVLQRAIGVFLEANDPLVADRLRAKLRAILDEQGLLYARLLAQKDALNLHVYRTVTTAILASVYVLLMVCVVVTAVLTPAISITPAPMVALAAIASMNPIGHARVVMNHIWNKYEERLRRRTEIVKALMEATISGITVQDLEGIRVVVQALQGRIQSLSDAGTAVINLRNDRVLNATIDDMEKKIDEFARAIKDLQAKKDECYKDVVGALFLFRRTKPTA